MKDRHKTLKEMLIEDLVPGFVRELVDGMDSIYSDSYETITQDPNLGDAQARDVLGHYRRGRAETHLFRTAAKHGLRPKDTKPLGGGCGHVSLTVGRFELVLCHVPSRDAFPRHSLDREQSSQANQCLSQLPLLKEPVSPGSGEFFGVIIHTERFGKKLEFGSIKVGFPNHLFDGWLEEPICLLEIADIQSCRFQKKSDLQAQVQNPRPLWKARKRNDKEAKDGA